METFRTRTFLSYRNCPNILNFLVCANLSDLFVQTFMTCPNFYVCLNFYKAITDILPVLEILNENVQVLFKSQNKTRPDLVDLSTFSPTSYYMCF